MPSKSTALFEWAILLLLLLLLPEASRAQDDTPPWFWIMANSVDGKVVCPGLCLAVNDSSSTGNYADSPVGFVACKNSDSSSSDGGSASSDTNNNQQWLRDDGNKEETTIRINATGSTETTGSTLLCLQPDRTTNRSLTVTKCNGQSNQKWIVANNTVASLAFDPPRSLAMSYRVSAFLTLNDVAMAWREASVVAGNKPPNSSLTTTFSLVEGDDTRNLELNPPEDKAPPQSRNFISNGGFEQSSYGFPNASTNLSLNVDDIFGLCYWKIIKTDANLQNGQPETPEGNRSLYLKDGIVSQKVTTLPGAFYTIVFKVAVATSLPSDTSASSSEQTCQGSDTLSVNPYPSTNVDMTVEVSNKSWVTNHVSFQALGNQVQLAFKGCSACGCYLDEVNLMQVIDHAPFPPPPRRPSPPPSPKEPEPKDTYPPGQPRIGFPNRHSNRLSNAAVVGVVVGAAALFFVIGAACFAVVCLSKKEKGEVETMDTRRPAEWSIHTTTPARSERTKASANGSIHQASSNAPTSAVGATMSSSNTQSGSAPSAP
uniref:TSA: Wollemia nobilis Ref_Wollemi_Transcript_14252_2172 transcribed RNA sequence n=1 Tax=Wollemia nobilis TaxID=56998 RepID=A0A0C9RT14_9CONI